MVRPWTHPLLTQAPPLEWAWRGGGSCWMEPFLAQPQPCRSLAYSLVNVHCHGQVVPGKDRRVVVEAALGTDVELRAPGSRKEM